LPKRTARDFALIGRVWSEIGSGRISEGFIKDGMNFTDGFYNGNGHITVNPAQQTVETVIHECLHRAFPAWSENYVRRTTTYLRRRMSDEEVQAMYAEYLKRARKRRTPKVIEQ
jgi:hypothetical protein